jgi:hypothetical protein
MDGLSRTDGVLPVPKMSLNRFGMIKWINVTIQSLSLSLSSRKSKRRRRRRSGGGGGRGVCSIRRRHRISIATAMFDVDGTTTKSLGKLGTGPGVLGMTSLSLVVGNRLFVLNYFI